MIVKWKKHSSSPVHKSYSTQNKDILLLYQDPSDHSLAEILPTPSSSGTVLVRTNGHHTTKWTNKLNHTWFLFVTLIKDPGSSVNNPSAKTLPKNGKCSLKTHLTKEANSWTLMTMTVTSLPHHTQRGEAGSILLASQIPSVQELQDLSRITSLLASTKPDSSQEKLTPALVTTHSLRPDTTFCESVHDITITTRWGMSLAKSCSS